MSMTFLFWLSALYTLALFGVQVAEFATAAHVQINVSTANAFYLALLSAYVGGKEVHRWTIGFHPEKLAAEGETQPAPFRLKGEWFVGLWAVFLLVAVLGSEIWPARLAYPKGLTLIAFEVLGFYIGSSASRWLSVRVEEKAHQELERQLEAKGESAAPPPSSPPTPSTQHRWVSRKRERYEKIVLDATGKSAGLRREDVEKLLNLSRTATLRILGSLMDRGLIKRAGDPRDPATLYQSGQAATDKPA